MSKRLPLGSRVIPGLNAPSTRVSAPARAIAFASGERDRSTSAGPKTSWSTAYRFMAASQCDGDERRRSLVLRRCSLECLVDLVQIEPVSDQSAGIERALGEQFQGHALFG